MERKTLVSVLAVAGGALVLVLALVIGISLGGGKSKSSPNTANLKMAASIEEMLSGIPQSGTVIGGPKAKVTLVEFGDLQCTGCAYFSANGLPNLIQNYVRTGKLRIEFEGQTFIDKYRPGSSPDSNRLMRMALATGEQNKLWNFIEIVYANQGQETSGYATDSYLKAVGNAIQGLDVNKAFKTASPTTAFSSQIKASASRFAAEGFKSTPSFLLGLTTEKSRQKVSEGDLTARIDALLTS
jgi:hypothetical protein